MTDSLELAVMFLAARFDAWLLLNAKGVAILAFAVVAAAGLARASAATRHLLWEGALLALLILPAMGLIVPVWAVSVWRSPALGAGPSQSALPAAVEGSTDFAATAPSRHAFPESDALIREHRELAASELDAGSREKIATAIIPPKSGPSPTEHGPVEQLSGERDPNRLSLVDSRAAIVTTPDFPVPSVSPGQVLAAVTLAVWAVGVAWLLARLAAALLALARLGAQSRRISGGRAFALFAQTARELGIGREVRLLAARDRSVPMAWGVFRPTVLIPEAFLAWPPERLRLILAHELVHVRRRDAFVDLAAQLAWALHWMNPLGRLALSRLRLEREQACDDQVLELTSRPVLYAETLLSVAAGASASRHAPQAALLMARPSQVEHRLRALLDKSRDRARLSKSRVVAGTLAAAALIALLSSLHPVASSAAAPSQQPRPVPVPRLATDGLAPGRSEELPLTDSERAQGSRLPATTVAALAPADDPDVDAARRQHSLGRDHLFRGEMEQAEVQLSAAVKTLAALVSRHPSLAWDLEQAEIDLGHVWWPAGRLKEATELWNKRIRLMEQKGTAGLEESQRRDRAIAVASVAERYAELALWDESAEAFRVAFETYGALPIERKSKAVFVACAMGDRELYRKWARDLFVRFGRSEKPDDRQLVIAALTLDPQPGVDPMQVAALIESFAEMQRAAQENLPQIRRLQPPRALAEVNAALNSGRFADAEPRGRLAVGSPVGIGAMAIVEMQKDRRDRAEYWLDRFDLEMSEECRRLLAVQPKPVSRDWTDFVGTRALYARAQRAVRGDGGVKDPWLLLVQGRNRAQAGLADRAERDLTRAVALAPADPLVWTAQGQIFLEMGRANRARQGFATALRLAPNEPWPLLQEAHTYLMQGEVEQAEQAFARAAALPDVQLDSFLQAGWWVAGPYPSDMASAYPPEQATDVTRPLDPVQGAGREPGSIHWRRALPVNPLPTSRETGSVDLREYFPTRTPGSIYSMTFVYSPADQDTFMKFGSRGPRRLWVNGVLANESAQPFPTWNTLDRVPIRLRKGLNRLLVKTIGAPSPISFFARLDDADYEKGNQLFHSPLFGEGAAALEAALTPPYGTYDWGIAFRLALARAGAGDWDGYRRWRDARWPDLEDGSYASAAWWVGQLFAFGSTDLPPDPAQWIEVLRWGLTQPAEVDPGYAHAVFTLALLRTGKTKEALEVASRVQAANYPLTWPALALIHHRAGNAGEARLFLDRSDRWWSETIDNWLADRPLPVPMLAHQWIPFMIVHREAHATVRNAEPPKDPGWSLLVARARVRHGMHERAALDLAEAVATHPEDATVWIRRAKIFAEFGMLPRVTGDLDQAAELATTPAERLALAQSAARGYQAAQGAKDDALAEACRTRAIAALRGAMVTGSVDRRGLGRDPGLQPIWNVPEFKALIE